jgi:gas vesicle protein
MTNTGKIATGVLVGTVLGAALGLLLAPKKGSKTRALIADKAAHDVYGGW